MAGSKSAKPRKATFTKVTRSISSKSAKENKSLTSSHVAANAIDEQLARYRSMRDFNITEEPSGSQVEKNLARGLPFCVQKHAASHLHYDFRLGWNGVLKSWAIAKGPSYLTNDKRLAVQVEDHPIEYGGFEGIIPKGQYGGGTVMLWDQGTWEPQAEYTDIDAGLREGSLKFLLHGTKLKGKWALIRMGGKWAREKKPNWLLIKEHDEFERTQNDSPVTETEPNSVVTDRSIDEIASNRDHVWNSKNTRSGDRAWLRRESSEDRSVSARPKVVGIDLERRLIGLPQEHQLAFFEPQLALMGETPPSGKGWLHELKLDGYRMQARKDGKKVQILTRTGLDWTHRMSAIAQEITKLAIEKITLDGEVVVVAPNGTTSFADLQASMQERAKHILTYFAFDLLHIDGRNTRDLPLRERKELLSNVLRGADEERLRLSEHIEIGGAELLHEACKLQAEGIVSKRAEGKYRSGRSSDWLKMKCLHEQEFVVGGYTLPTNKIHGVGSLLLGYYQNGKLIYAGRTGTGFTQKMHRMLRDKLEGLTQMTTSFENLPVDARKGAIWVKPKIVVQVRFATWTTDALVRQAAFLGIREDKTAQEVIREESGVSIGPKQPRAKAITRHKNSDKAASDRQAISKKAKGQERAPVRLTHAQKILDESSGMTKQMLADYYWAVAPWMLQHIANRPVSLVRCPEGAGHTCFFQKHVNSMLSEGIGSLDIVDKRGKREPYITLNTAEALAGLAQIGVLEIHPWGSRNENLEHPDRLIFDLDPDEELEWSDVTESAIEVKMQLKKLGLESFVKTTGGKGLHVVVPIEPKADWPTVKEYARSFVVSMEKEAPQRYLTKMTKAARKGKIYLDYLRNERGATSVSAYSPRARVSAPISMPLSWNELRKHTRRPVFNVAGFEDWKDRLKKDPWEGLDTVWQKLILVSE